jgi:hypothetical protein
LVSLARERAAAIFTAPASRPTSSIPSFTVGDCRTVPHKDNEFDFVMIMGNSFGYFSANDTEVDDGQEPSSDAADRMVLKEINRVLAVFLFQLKLFCFTF